MIPVNEALEAILNAVYGKEVRQALHDGLYRVNENANEAVQTAKAIGVGMQIVSSSSPTDGYVIDNLYLNTETWDLWKCTGDAWELQGNIKGAEGDSGDPGDPGEPGTDGTNAYIHIRYSTAADGTGFVSTPTSATKYIGIYAGTSSAAPTDKTAYVWSKYVGDSGTGAGDMTKAVYDTNDDGKVDAAEDADKLGGQLPEYYQTALNDATTSVSGKMSATDKAKLDGIATGANNYSLPTASDTVKGGVKIGTGLSMLEEVLNAAVAGLIDDETDFDAQTGSTSQAVDSYLLMLLLSALKGKVLTGTLTAAATSITFTDAAIVTDDTVMYTVRNNKGVNYTAQSLSAGSLTLTYPAQASNMTVLLIIQEV